MAEVVTGEAVVLEVPCARFASRALAIGIDVLIQLTMLVILLVGVGVGSGNLDQAALRALALTTTVLVIVGYPVLWETTTRGRSPGKFALGLRVVSDDGSPERFRQALVRGLTGFVEFWLLFGSPALICSLISVRGKRLGDVFAGTFVIQQRLPAGRPGPAGPTWMPPALAGWAAGLEMSRLTGQTAAMARGYLARLGELTPDANAGLGQRIAATVMTQVSPPPPPGTPVLDFLAAVLAERSRREYARMASTGQARPATAPAGTAPVPTPLPPATPRPDPAEPNAGGFVAPQ